MGYIRRRHHDLDIGGTMRIMRGVRSLFVGAVVAAALPAVSSAQVSLSVSFGPPALPVYEQPPCPQPDYMWAPGYWSYADNVGYYWVPGTWVAAPTPGYLWTPGYWGWNSGVYVWNGGYWGQHVGYYGGLNYGYGYAGAGYQGGYWNNGHVYYNRSVNNISTTTNITNVYNKTVINNTTVTNVSYNGGPGGASARPTAAEQAVAHEQHAPPTSFQTQQEHAAVSNHAQWASQNQGKPAVAATAKPGAFTGSGVVAARSAGAPYHPPVKSPPARGVAAGGTPGAKPAGGPPPAVHSNGAPPPHPNNTNAPPPAKAPPPKAGPPQGNPQVKPQGNPQTKPQTKPQPENQPKGQTQPKPDDHPKPQGNPKPEGQPKESPKPPPEQHDAPPPDDKPKGS
jgi:hypothetical protein